MARLAKALEKLRDQINDAAPMRMKSSDGWIGDAKHSKRKSDHNPTANGVVQALDITHDPKHGVDCGKIAEALVKSRDPRIKYIIWNRQIVSATQSPWKWRAYTGPNPHTLHIHISVKDALTHFDDTRMWSFGDAKPDKEAPQAEVRPLLVPGGRDDAFLQAAKNLLINQLRSEDGFGPLMEGLAKAFQKKHGLVADGKIGPYTWAKLG